MGTPTPLRARFGLDNQSNVIRNIGNESSVSAAIAGAGALRINSNTLQISDGANWNNAGSGITRSIVNISAVTTGAAAAAVDYVYICTGTFTYTQPTAVGNTNRYTIKNGGVGIITIVFTSGQNADGSTTIALNPEVALDFISNNTNWVII